MHPQFQYQVYEYAPRVCINFALDTEAEKKRRGKNISATLHSKSVFSISTQKPKTLNTSKRGSPKYNIIPHILEARQS